MSIENEIVDNVEEDDANQLLYKFNSLQMPKWINKHNYKSKFLFK